MKFAVCFAVVVATLLSTVVAQTHPGCIRLCSEYYLQGACTEYCNPHADISPGPIRSVDIGAGTGDTTLYTSPNYQRIVGTANYTIDTLHLDPPVLIRSINIVPWIAPGCVRIYEDRDFGGSGNTFCGAHDYVGHAWNDMMSSYLTGPGTTVQFWEHANSGGAYSVRSSTQWPARVVSVGGFEDKMSSLRAFRNE